jgi:NAD-dependent deacetylase
MEPDDHKKCIELIQDSQRLVVFTGAGLSAESGIPTYRGAGGLWSKYDPEKFASIDYFMQNPSYYWQFFKEERYPIIKSARPNQAHHALVKLEKQDTLFRVITQNIDGLHQEAGQSRVIELHGNTRRIRCLDCSKIYPMEEIFQRLDKEPVPLCSCGGRLKPDVVMFGEGLPPRALNDAWEAARYCDTFMVAGSSLVVNPAAQIPVLARQNGASLVIINIDPTPLDGIADLVIHSPVSEVFSSIV